MKRMILESPFAGNVPRNIAYAKMCVKDMLRRNEAPIASHLLFTQEGILDDLKPEERTLGIDAGHAWLMVTEGIAFYTDFGISKGMEIAIERAKNKFLSVEFRTLPPEQVEELIKKYQ